MKSLVRSLVSRRTIWCHLVRTPQCNEFRRKNKDRLFAPIRGRISYLRPTPWNRASKLGKESKTQAGMAKMAEHASSRRREGQHAADISNFCVRSI